MSLLFLHQTGFGQQTLSLKEALQVAVANYPTIKAKENFKKSSIASAEEAKREYLPNLILSGQQDYGTVNGQNGPLYSYGYAVASSGIPENKQNWNAGFGALYLANVNWEFFAFGRAKQRVKTAESYITRDAFDQEQEIFEHQIKVASAYLNLLAAQRLTRSEKYNLDRADTLKLVVTLRAKNGLIAGVDSSLANAEVSNARTALTNAKDFEEERASQLALLIGLPQGDFLLDSVFITKLPATFTDTANPVHPLLQFYNSRISSSDAEVKYLSTLRYPVFSFFGVMQDRGSNFPFDYLTNNSGYNKSYWSGVSPDRANYVVGIGLTWNVTSLARVKKQVEAQSYISNALKNEYDLVDLQLKNQQLLADKKIENAISNYHEAPVQVKSATDAFNQKEVLYRNGLTDIIDVTQTLYTLNRAETNRDIAYNNVWQSLLLRAASTGNLDLFTKNAY